jgi:hypothetical protein
MGMDWFSQWPDTQFPPTARPLTKSFRCWVEFEVMPWRIVVELLKDVRFLHLWVIIMMIIIIIIIIIGISFMQGIYTYIPETNHVPREHGVATILV